MEAIIGEPVAVRRAAFYIGLEFSDAGGRGVRVPYWRCIAK